MRVPDSFGTLSTADSIPNGADEIARGTNNQVPVFPREIVSALLKRNASGAVICHNHPSGNPKPSDEDLRLTQTLSQLLNECGIKLFDHILVANADAVSFVENKWFSA